MDINKHNRNRKTVYWYIKVATIYCICHGCRIFIEHYRQLLSPPSQSISDKRSQTNSGSCLTNNVLNGGGRLRNPKLRLGAA